MKVLLLLPLVKEFHALLTIFLLKFPFQSRIVVVLDVVVCAPWQILGDLRPSVTVFLVELKDKQVLLPCPFVFLDVRIQVIVPPLSTQENELRRPVGGSSAWRLRQKPACANLW